jgi:hypothetical protein
VDLTVCVPFTPDSILAAPETDVVQSAAAVRYDPYAALLIYAVPYGLQPAADGLPAAEPGIANTYQDLSVKAYEGEILESLAGPSISVFGRALPGRTVIVPNKIGTPATGQQMITQWVVEAGDRIWILRLILTADSFADKAAAFRLMEDTALLSVDVNRPSTSLRLSQQAPAAEQRQPSPTAADLPFPSWWSGDCDVNNFAGSYPLGASYRGVKACGPRSTWHLVRFAPDLFGEYEWQCVELAMRYLYLAFGIVPYGANGKDVVWNYSGTRLQKIVNGTPNKGPSPGDVVSYANPSSVGHTAIVSAANIDASGDGSITIVEQNYYDAGGARTQQVLNWVIQSSDAPTGWLHDPQAGATAHFAVIGDYGLAGTPEADVSTLVKSWQPDFVVTLGDNNYPSGSASTIDANIGQYYHEFISPYSGIYGAGAAFNRFFPVLGNHDWGTPNAQPYLDYFTLPVNPLANERYYDFVRGPVHFFMLDSDASEPDGNTASSAQAAWLQAALASSVSRWNIVLLHHAPFSSGSGHGSDPVLQWPFQQWGADAVLAGHDHTYERLVRGGFPYFVNGLGGASIYGFNTPVAGSLRRYNSDYGAMLVDASTTDMAFQFISRTGAVQDTYRLPFLTISGNAGVAGATLSYTDGTFNTLAADAAGNYSLTVSDGWSGTVTPSLGGYIFTPASRPYSTVTGDQANQDYGALPQILRLFPTEGSQVCVRPAIGVELLFTDIAPPAQTLTLDAADVTGEAVQWELLMYPPHAIISYTPPADMAPGAHSAEFDYETAAGPQVLTWNFTVVDTLSCPTDSAPPASSTDPPSAGVRGAARP